VPVVGPAAAMMDAVARPASPRLQSAVGRTLVPVGPPHPDRQLLARQLEAKALDAPRRRPRPPSVAPLSEQSPRQLVARLITAASGRGERS
jgi:hypothetical protein